MKVLIVDDEHMIRDIAAKILKRAGVEVATAESGLDALEVLNSAETDIDIVILDLMMEGISGVKTLEEMRKFHPELPCIISTGQSLEPDDLPEHLKENTHFLQKPYRANQLTEVVRQVAPVG